MEIEIQGDGLLLREDVEVFGDVEKYEKKVDNGEYEIRMSTEGYIPLSELVEYQKGEGDELHSVRLCLDEIDGLSTSVRKIGQEEGSESSSEKGVSSRDEPPEPPQVKQFSNPTREQFYRRLVDNPNSQPATMRRIIFNEGKIKKKNLKKRMVNEGYEPGSGGFSASLVVLSDVTQEVRRSGRGEKETITWIGK